MPSARQLACPLGLPVTAFPVRSGRHERRRGLGAGVARLGRRVRVRHHHAAAVQPGAVAVASGEPRQTDQGEYRNAAGWDAR